MAIGIGSTWNEDYEPKQLVTNKVKKAFNHVKDRFPTLSIVIFTKDQRWCYMDEDFSAFDFMSTDINVSILEEALDSIDNLPFIYQP